MPVLIDPYGHTFAPANCPLGKRIIVPVPLPSLGNGVPWYLPDPRPGAQMLSLVFELSDDSDDTVARYRLAGVEWMASK